VRVAVVGAGGTGGFYGGMLARAGHQVGFLARGRHLAAIQAHGLTVRSAQFGNFTVTGPACDAPDSLGPADLVIFAVKTYDLELAAQAAARLLGPGSGLNAESVLLTLQNGVEAPDRVAEIVGAEHVLIGTTAIEATIVEPGVVAQLSPSHRLTVSELHGPPSPRVERLVETLDAAEINASVVADGRVALWQKAAALIPFAGLTTASGRPIGAIRALPEAYAALRDGIAETLALASACGHPVPGGIAAIDAITNAMAPTMTSSLARDFERGGRTELEALQGAVVRLGEQHGVPVPVTRALYATLRLRAGDPSSAQYNSG
jgi:2-dehydropantoate 2-reductase